MRIHILLPTTLAFRCYKWLIMFAIQKRSYINKSVFTLVLRLSTWRYQLSACIAYQLSIGICCRRPRSAANQPHVVVAVDRPDRQTDGRTPDRYIDSTPHTVDESPPFTVSHIPAILSFLLARGQASWRGSPVLHDSTLCQHVYASQLQTRYTVRKTTSKNEQRSIQDDQEWQVVWHFIYILQNIK